MQMDVNKFNEIAIKMLRVYVSVEFKGLVIKDEDVSFYYYNDAKVEGKVSTIPNLLFQIKIKDNYFEIQAVKKYPTEIFELSEKDKKELCLKLLEDNKDHE